MNPAEVLADEMKKAKLSRNQLAELTGVSREGVRLWLTGSGISEKNAQKLAEIFDVEPSLFAEAITDIDLDTFAGRLKDLRVKRHLDMTVIAEQTGVAYATLNKIENGRLESVSINTIEALAKFFKVDKSYFTEVNKKRVGKIVSPVKLQSAYMSDLQKIIDWRQKNLISEEEFNKLKSKIFSDL